jgi:energy-coupling factor transport system ATP-binding protein
MCPIVQIKDLSYSYRRQKDRFALRGINLEIEKGEFVAIAGRAGSGKSTLCYALNGLIPHSFGGTLEGKVTVCGLDTRKATVPELARRVGFVMQSAESQLVGLSVEEDVAFGPENLGLPSEEVAQRVETALQTVGLKADLRRSPWALSGGQKQRLSIAASLAMQPQVLVLDNPTAELDPLGKEEVMSALGRLNSKQGVTIVIVDQEIEEILPYATRLVLMNDGKILSLGSPQEVINRPENIVRSGVRLPEVAQVAGALRAKGRWLRELPVTIEDAAKGLEDMPCIRRSSRKAEASSVPPDGIIQFEEVNFTYPDSTVVLRNVSLTIKKGEFVTLMGPNGAGKTTLAKHMNGLLSPTAGRVLVRGTDTRTVRVSELARTVGYVFQNPDHQLFERSIEKELAFGPRNLGWSKAQVASAVESGLSHTGEASRRDDDPFFLGLAERKLVSIASVLAMGPEVLVLDEPATGADHEAALRIMNYLTDLHRQGLTVVIVTHDVLLAANYSQRIIVMRSGSVALDGTPNEIFHNSDLLRRCSIVPPAVAQLSVSLGMTEFTCRVDEMVESFAGGVDGDGR